MQRLGIQTILVCSNVGTATIDSDMVSADQLRLLGDLAEDYYVRIAFEALAWGRFVDDYRRSWRIVERADHPRIGLCLDSFHILSRGHDPAGIEQIPGEKIFYLQLADAPALSMDVLSWSRHHRLFPGEVPGIRRLRGARAPRRLFRAAVARGFQRHIPADRRGPDRGSRAPSLVWLEDQVAQRQGAGRNPAAVGRRGSGQAAAHAQPVRAGFRRGQG